MKSLRKYRVSKKRNRRMRKTSISNKKRKINQVGGLLDPQLFEDLLTKNDSTKLTSKNKLNEDLLRQLSPDQFVELVRWRSGLGWDLEKVIKEAEPELRRNYQAWMFQPDTVEELITKGKSYQELITKGKSYQQRMNGELQILMRGLQKLYREINTELRKLNPKKAQAEDDARVAAMKEEERLKSLKWSEKPLAVRADMMGMMAHSWRIPETERDRFERRARAAEAEAARRMLTPDLLMGLNTKEVAVLATRRAGIVPPDDCVRAMIRARVTSVNYQWNWTPDHIGDVLNASKYFQDHLDHRDKIIDALVAMAAEADAQGAREAMDADPEFDTLTKQFNNLKISSGPPSSRHESPTSRRSNGK
jgi:hypothetical protein